MKYLMPVYATALTSGLCLGVFLMAADVSPSASFTAAVPTIQAAGIWMIALVLIWANWEKLT